MEQHVAVTGDGHRIGGSGADVELVNQFLSHLGSRTWMPTPSAPAMNQRPPAPCRGHLLARRHRIAVEWVAPASAPGRIGSGGVRLGGVDG
jgi:hypothetical protein